MAPTSEERQAMAEKLRESAQAGEYLDQSIAKAILSTMSADEVYTLPIGSILADLIDPTCEVEGSEPLYMDDETEFRLSCGHVADMTTNEPPAYCPECGARVTGGDGR